jgi:Flp pilus assembly protein CpaB
LSIVENAGELFMPGDYVKVVISGNITKRTEKKSSSTSRNIIKRTKKKNVLTTKNIIGKIKKIYYGNILFFPFELT